MTPYHMTSSLFPVHLIVIKLLWLCDAVSKVLEQEYKFQEAVVNVSFLNLSALCFNDCFQCFLSLRRCVNSEIVSLSIFWRIKTASEIKHWQWIIIITTQNFNSIDILRFTLISKDDISWYEKLLVHNTNRMAHLIVCCNQKFLFHISFFNKLYSIIIHRIPAIGYIKLAIDDDKLNSFKIGLIQAFVCIISLLKISTGENVCNNSITPFRPVNTFYHSIPYYTQNFLLESLQL